ncbi:3-coathanger stack domain-containing protein [Runella sp.]|uniref:3-coathanger stack domain-containing protein n=1 Tax=Runella sp. TaxID=1960881 RepID=UPI003D0ADFF0
MFINRFSGPKISVLILYLGIITSQLAQAQLAISFPFDGAVFQRTAFNNATLFIAGSYTGAVERVEARLIAAAGGTSIDWTSIDYHPAGGIYKGSLSSVTGGWYTLEVRSIVFNNVVSTTSLGRVGVGEVFIIAGQSNVQGIENHGNKASSDGQERIKYVNWLLPCPDGTCQNIDPPFPQISTLNSTDQGLHIAPNGNTSWAWGELGDKLLARFNVPVLFFNAAASGSSVGNWSRSADGLPSAHPHIGIQYGGNPNFPYHYLRKALNYYASLFGVRAVLWHQGESDTVKNRNNDPNDNTSATEYRDSLNYVINKSRNHSNKILLPWVVAKVSYWLDAGGGSGMDSEVIAGQNATINTGNKIFDGPNTDNIQIPRVDGVHLENVTNGIQGISEMATAWNTSLSDNFFVNATPYAAADLPSLSLGCSGNTYTITAPSGYASYYWVNGNNDISSVSPTGQILSVPPGSGTYRVYLKDSSGNIILSQAVTVPATTPQPPSLSAVPSNITAGQSVTLYAQGCSGGVAWSTGQGGYSVSQTPSQTTTYTATCSIGSCVSVPASVQVSTCQSDITITAQYVSGQNVTVKASNSITGLNAVRAGATIIYDAKNAVILQPGFLAEQNSLFTAVVGGGCSN